MNPFGAMPHSYFYGDDIDDGGGEVGSSSPRKRFRGSGGGNGAGVGGGCYGGYGGGPLPPPSSQRQRHQQQQQQQQSIQHPQHQQVGSNNGNGNGNMNKLPKDMKIPEVLAKNVAERLAVMDLVDGYGYDSGSILEKGNEKGNEYDESSQLQLQKQRQHRHRPQEGDVASLALRVEYFFGVKVGWPFPEMMKPQRLMCVHVVKALQAKRHCVLESPTGTGKSAAILCSVLAWQRHHEQVVDAAAAAKTKKLAAAAAAGVPVDPGTGPPSEQEQQEEEPRHVKIIYCSRTHSQVAQMVQSLLKTPYRPAMTVLGGRDRFCIHEVIRGAGGDGNNGTKKRLNVNNECRIRMKNTDSARRYMLEHQHDSPYGRGDFEYSDALPPLHWERDEIASSSSGNGNFNNGNNENEEIAKPTCPHYRQLTSARTTETMLERFRPSSYASASAGCSSSTCGGGCSDGGDGSDTAEVDGHLLKDGTHDIEDLVAYGRDPDCRTIRIRRSSSAAAAAAGRRWGIKLDRPANSEYPVVVAISNPRIGRFSGLRVLDRVLELNGTSLRGRSLSDCCADFEAATDLTLKVAKSPSSPLEPGGYSAAGGGDDDDEGGEVSPHAVCPYYVSRTLQKHAQLVFAPYNYILDPGIRKSLNISLEGSVVVLDEAHNVEDCLRESGSGSWSEFELCEIAAALQHYSGDVKLHQSSLPSEDGGGPTAYQDEKLTVNEMAHALLVFIERMVLFVFDAKTRFESSPAGAKKALSEWQRYHSPPETTSEMTYDGPSGVGLRGEPVGCRTFFDKVHGGNDGAAPKKQQQQHPIVDGETLCKYADEVQSFVMKQEHFEVAKYGSHVETMVDLVSKMCLAKKSPEHYFIQTKVKPNGSFEFASGSMVSDRGANYTKNPKILPSIGDPEPCRFCKHSGDHELITSFNGKIKHASYCSGQRPQWEAVLVLDLLSPAHFMQDVLDQSRSVILASGSLAPLPSLCGELGLSAVDTTADGKQPLPAYTAAASAPTGAAKSTPPVASKLSVPEPPPKPAVVKGRLQVHPPPLEADHVINLEKQLLAVAVGHFPSGEKLSVTYNNYKHDSFLKKLGGSIATIIESVPRGGILVFLPSYKLLRKCVKLWQSTGYRNNYYDDNDVDDTWERLVSSKGKVIVEPTGTQADFEAARDEYAETIKTTGNCVLFAVFRGKMSEGISFNDDNARAVICCGVPFPNSFDRGIKAKKCYNEEQRKFSQRKLLPGDMWYKQQAYRALAQALGRCIRHAGDYGAIFLLDSRHCDESPPDPTGTCMAHRELPKWMRSHIKTLTMRRHGDPFGKSLCGGWEGLKGTLSKFFAEAPPYAEEVLQKQQESLRKIQDRAGKTSSGLRFDRASGQWTPSKTAGSASSTPAAGGSISQSTTKSENVDNSLTPLGQAPGSFKGGSRQSTAIEID